MQSVVSVVVMFCVRRIFGAYQIIDLIAVMWVCCIFCVCVSFKCIGDVSNVVLDMWFCYRSCVDV